MPAKTIDPNEEKFESRNLLDLSKANLIKYGTEVILNRALPDYRDGLKPVLRRILWSMYMMSLRHNGPHVKCARIVGEVMGKYHPHGDQSIYMAMVKAYQNQPVCGIDPMGNFGSLTEPKPAAMRYTEARLSKYGETQFFPQLIPKMVEAITTFVPNFDGKEKEPLFLPCLMPNILLNGTEGIAVGITSNIPPISMKSLVPFLTKAIEGEELSAKKMAKKLEFNWVNGSHCISEEEKIIDWIENGRGSLRFEPQFESSSKTRTLTVTEAPIHFNWDKVVDNITKVDKNGKPKYPFISSIDDMTDKDGLAFEVKFKNTIDPMDFTNYVEKIMKEFTNSFSCATNITLRKKDESKFFRSNIIDVIERWCRYRVNLEVKMQNHLISVYDKDLSYYELLFKVITGRDNIRDAWNKTDPREYVQNKLKITEEEARQVLSWNLMAPSNLNKDKILKDKAETIKLRKVAKAIADNPSPTVLSYLNDNAEPK